MRGRDRLDRARDRTRIPREARSPRSRSQLGRGRPKTSDAAVVLLPEPPRLGGVAEHLVHARPTSGKRSSGRKHASVPTFVGCQLSPPSSVRKTPAAEIPIHSLLGVVRVEVIECVIKPPAPGVHFSRVSWPSTPSLTCQVAPESSERKSTPGSPPSQRVVGSEAWRGLEVPGRRELQPALLRQAETLRPRPGLTEVGRALDRPAVDPAVRAGVQGAVARIDDGMVDLPAG